MKPLAGRYRLTGELGRGGMGTVWRARDETLNRDVAIKELALPRETTEERRELAVRRALREARAAARLRHPGIITVHDVVPADGRPWIVMELLSGRSLDRLIELDGPLEPRRAAEIGIEILDALCAAHEHGVLHRDVKPANVFLRDDGRVVLTDFGIASLTGDAPLTRPGALIGSPAYMAPESIRGEPAGPSADLWSLGATLYALVEGRTPFARSTPMGVLSAVLADQPAAPRRAGPLTGPLLRLLAKDPVARPTATRVRRELADIAGTPPHAGTKRGRIKGGGTGRAGIRRGWARRGVLAVLACLVVAAVTGSVLLWNGRSERAGRPAPITTVPPLCGMISVTRMNRLVPSAGVGGMTNHDAHDYFNQYEHPRAQSCEWHQHNYVGYGYVAGITTRPAETGPHDDPMKPAHADLARLRQAAATTASTPGFNRTAPRTVPRTGDEAFAYDHTPGDPMFREYHAVVVFRTRNLLTEVNYTWDKKGAPPPGGIAPLRAGAVQISQWMDAALRAGRPAPETCPAPCSPTPPRPAD